MATSAKFTIDDESPLAWNARRIAAKRFEEFTARTVVQSLLDEIYWEKEFHELVFSGNMRGGLIPPRIKLPGYGVIKKSDRHCAYLIRSALDRVEFWVKPRAWSALGEQVRDLLNPSLSQHLAGEMRISDGLVRIQKGALTRSVYAQPLLELERLT